LSARELQEHQQFMLGAAREDFAGTSYHHLTAMANDGRTGASCIFLHLVCVFDSPLNDNICGHDDSLNVSTFQAEQAQM
jgi:hypothetical protein